MKSVLRGHHALHLSFHYNGWDCDGCGRTEIWVGDQASGKTTYLHTLLMREYLENDIPFQVIDPTTRGQTLANALGVTHQAISLNTVLNPQDIVCESVWEQARHVLLLYELILQRQLSGSKTNSLQRKLLTEALYSTYQVDPQSNSHWVSLDRRKTATCTDVLTTLATLGNTDENREIARNLADELGRLATGSGPYAAMLDGHTVINETFQPGDDPASAVYTLANLTGTPMMAYACAHLLGSILPKHRAISPKRLIPRYLALDHIDSMIRTENLADGLAIFAKYCRFKRQALICINNQLPYFLKGKMQFVLEMSAINLFFHATLQHEALTNTHYDYLSQANLDLIKALPPHEFVFDEIEAGSWHLQNRMSPTERHWLLPNPTNL